MQKVISSETRTNLTGTAMVDYRLECGCVYSRKRYKFRNTENKKPARMKCHKHDPQ
jgi:hypothetical protein